MESKLLSTYKTLEKKEQLENRQRLAMVCVARSGLITCAMANTNIPQSIRDDLEQTDKLLHDAQSVCGCDAFCENTVRSLLQVFQSSLKLNNLAHTEDMITTIAVTQTALDYLRDFSSGQLHDSIDPILNIVSKLGAHLHGGMKMKYLQDKFDNADKIVELLFRVINYKG